MASGGVFNEDRLEATSEREGWPGQTRMQLGQRNGWRDIALSVAALAGLGLAAVGAETPPAVEPKVDFARDIRPILAEHCVKCHGLDRKAREAGLRLDLREVALEKKAIVPGDPGASKLIARIEST